MTQDAVVINAFKNGMAEVSVLRGTACGGNCGNCEACVYQNELRTPAVNTANAVKGQHVIIESSSAQVYKAELVVYIMPLLFLIIGYLVASLLGAAEIVSALAGFVSLGLGVLVVVFTQKNKNDITFEIVRICDD